MPVIQISNRKQQNSNVTDSVHTSKLKKSEPCSYQTIVLHERIEN